MIHFEVLLTWPNVTFFLCACTRMCVCVCIPPYFVSPEDNALGLACIFLASGLELDISPRRPDAFYLTMIFTLVF